MYMVQMCTYVVQSFADPRVRSVVAFPLWGGVVVVTEIDLGDKSLTYKMELRCDYVGLHACCYGKTSTFKLQPIESLPL